MAPVQSGAARDAATKPAKPVDAKAPGKITKNGKKQTKPKKPAPKKNVKKPATTKKAKAPKEEFPGLAARGLMLQKTKGAGNCLFHAVSSQLYGTDTKHDEVRAQTVDFLSTHADTFKTFLAVNLGGGTRRNARRGASARSAAVDADFPSPEKIDKAWATYLRGMSEAGTYADNMEIVAISGAFGRTVEVFTGARKHEIKWEDQDGPLGVLRVAHHKFAHYSAIVEMEVDVEEVKEKREAVNEIVAISS